MSSRFLMHLIVLLVAGAACGPPAPPRPGDFVRKAAAGSSTMAISVACSSFPSDSCTDAADLAACTQAVGCGADNQCIFARSSAPGCPCFEGEVRWCDSSTVQFCARSASTPSTTAWQAECGPDTRDCSTGIPGCDAGKRRGVYDIADQAWDYSATNGQACVPTARCPANGETRWCDTGDPSCAGKETYSLASGWSGCERQCSPPPETECRPGAAQDCRTTEDCDGRRFCTNEGTWGSCSGRLRCPPGWPVENGQCVWHSPAEGSSFSHFPHRAGNDAVAVTAAIGHPAPGGQPGPLYLQVHLQQWSNPPKADGGNYCGKGNHVSTFVGCIRPNGARGYGRDVADHEWQSGSTMIELRCEAGDTVGVYKHSWGHDLSWHCTRQVRIGIARNHDSPPICVY